MECVVDAWLLKARPLPPSGSGPFPNPTQRNSAPPRGSWPLWAGGIHHARGPGLRLPDSDPARSVRPGSGGDPGQSRYSPWCAGGGVLSGLLIATRRRRHAVGALGGGVPGPCLSVVAGTRTPRDEQKGGAPPQDRNTSTFFFLQLGHEVPTHFFFLTHTRPLPNVFFCALTFCSKLTVRRVSVSICHYQKAWG